MEDYNYRLEVWLAALTCFPFFRKITPEARDDAASEVAFETTCVLGHFRRCSNYRAPATFLIHLRQYQ